MVHLEGGQEYSGLSIFGRPPPWERSFDFYSGWSLGDTSGLYYLLICLVLPLVELALTRLNSIAPGYVAECVLRAVSSTLFWLKLPSRGIKEKARILLAALKYVQLKRWTYSLDVLKDAMERQLYVSHGNYALLCLESNFCNVMVCGFTLGKNLALSVDEII